MQKSSKTAQGAKLQKDCRVTASKMLPSGELQNTHGEWLWKPQELMHSCSHALLQGVRWNVSQLAGLVELQNEIPASKSSQQSQWWSTSNRSRTPIEALQKCPGLRGELRKMPCVKSSLKSLEDVSSQKAATWRSKRNPKGERHWKIPKFPKLPGLAEFQNKRNR